MTVHQGTAHTFPVFYIPDEPQPYVQIQDVYVRYFAGKAYPWSVTNINGSGLSFEDFDQMAQYFPHTDADRTTMLTLTENTPNA